MNHIHLVSRQRAVPVSASNVLAKVALLVDALETLQMVRQLAELLGKDNGPENLTE